MCCNGFYIIDMKESVLSEGARQLQPSMSLTRHDSDCQLRAEDVDLGGVEDRDGDRDRDRDRDGDRVKEMEKDGRGTRTGAR